MNSSTTETPNTPRWSAQYTVTAPPSSTPPVQNKLVGDKITLPQSALEQLLSAATVTVVSEAEIPANFNPFNPYSRVSHEASQVLERHQNLPHPLTFRLVNPENGNVVYAGIREFSAEEDEVGVSDHLWRALGLEEEGQRKLTVHAQQLPKGTFVRLRPLEAGYDPEDWKSLLERQLRLLFTTLTKNEVLTIQAGKEQFRFLVDEIKPDGDGVCIVDTDLEVDIEALNEEQARETLKRRLEKTQRKPGAEGGSSAGGDISIGQVSGGHVIPGDYVDYTLKDWDRSKGLEIELEATEAEDIQLFISPFSRLQRNRPRQDEHVFAEVSTTSPKKIQIRHTNSELDGAEALYISIHGSGNENAQFSLEVRNSISTTKDTDTMDLDNNDDQVRCKNCHRFVPQRTMILHENFCLRNNAVCPHCHEVFQKNSPAHTNHWHCPHCPSAHGNTPSSHQHHDAFFHTPAPCTSCGYANPSLSALAQHKTSTCPEKPILCQFCHLLVPQQGPDDLDASDPEVVLSGLTPHELADGSSTTECHMCARIVRLRDMATHLRHHDLDRLSRPTPRLCRNENCGRTMDGVGANGLIKQPATSNNDVGLCDTCFGPLYNSAYDPDGKGLRRRVERKYLTQLLTGCGNAWCRNPMCKTGKTHSGVEPVAVSSKEALGLLKPVLEKLGDLGTPMRFCVDEASQKRRVMAEMVAGENEESGDGYRLPWCVAAMEAAHGDLDKGRDWLEKWAPRVREES